jgi:hypothetical protein
MFYVQMKLILFSCLFTIEQTVSFFIEVNDEIVSITSLLLVMLVRVKLLLIVLEVS